MAISKSLYNIFWFEKIDIYAISRRHSEFSVPIHYNMYNLWAVMTGSSKGGRDVRHPNIIDYYLIFFDYNNFIV